MTKKKYKPTQARIVVSLLTLITVLYLRSLHVVFFTAGAICCAITAQILKRLLRQPRPMSTKKSYGMPSSHSQVIAFFTTYIYCTVLHSSSSSSMGWLERALVLAAAGISGVSVIWSRVQLGHHTPAQVMVGATIGSVMAYGWYAVWTSYWAEE